MTEVIRGIRGISSRGFRWLGERSMRRICLYGLWCWFLSSAVGMALAADKKAPWTHPRSLVQVNKGLASISKSETSGDEKLMALARLKAYRYLAEVPYKDVVLDDEYNKVCLAGARLCKKLGRIEHRPENPGMSAFDFQLALAGTSQSNLGMGLPTLSAAVDAWMNDSDGANMGKVGHRRWCLNPMMQKTGFGRAGEYTAMYSIDHSRMNVPDFDMICYPARGYMPVEFFKAKSAWSVTLHPGKYLTPDKDFVPRVYRADAGGKKQGMQLALDFHAVDTTNIGIPNCIIFRPEDAPTNPGDTYLVELVGIRRRSDGAAVKLRYLVEFVKGQ